MFFSRLFTSTRINVRAREELALLRNMTTSCLARCVRVLINNHIAALNEQ